MNATQINELRMAAEGLILTDAQQHILAHRLARKLARKEPGTITVPELLGLIKASMRDMQTGVGMLHISDETYNDQPIVKRV